VNIDELYLDLLVASRSLEALDEAGYFSSGRVNDQSLLYYMTPIHLIKEAKEKDVSVLFYTGCFAPIHEGHVNVMRIAKETIEERTGEKVVAGFFSPDHDDYVLEKVKNPLYSSENRIEILNKFISDEDWLEVDPWASRYSGVNLNFTELYLRFVDYVKEFASEKNVKVYYVFGGDNYLFANAFVKRGHAVCVLRPETNVDFSKIFDSALERVLFSSKESSPHSSTEIRRQIEDELKIESREKEGMTYYLRDDLEFSLHPQLLKEAKNVSSQIKELVTENIPSYLNVEVHSAIEQKVETDLQTISLDTIFEGDYKLNLSRVFYPSSFQEYSKEFTHRPGSEEFKQQLKKIPEGSYTLVDDDISTGSTMNYAEELLSTRGISIKKRESLIKSHEKLYDVVDMRDFILGSKNGGLTVKLGEKITRVPYMFPFVNPVTRAKIEPSRARDFSRDMWLINFHLFLDTDLTLYDLIEEQDFRMFGVTYNMKVSDFCLFMASILKPL